MKIAIDFDSLIDVAMPNLGSGTTIGSIINKIMSTYFFPLLGFLLLFWIVFAGYQWMVSQGNPKSIASARNKILWGVVGFAIIFAAYWIVQIVGEILGIQQILNLF